MCGIIKDRIKNKMEQFVSENQFGFRSGNGTREVILSLRLILEILLYFQL